MRTYATILVLLLTLGPSWSAEPTLARLSFWVPPERMDAFATAYREKLLPILKSHGLVESSQPARATVDSVFSRLFEFDSPAEVVAMRLILIYDKKWAEQLEELGLEATWWPGRRFRFGHYATPAGPGRVVKAGPGKVVPAGRGRGQWRTYDTVDGLATQETRTILQDRRGYLWFGTWGGGVSRYDGQTFTTYTRNDVIKSNIVFSMVEDRDGNILIPGGGGISRYDGQSWTFLANEELFGVYRALEDRDGNLWFVTRQGVIRYDPRVTPLSTESIRKEKERPGTGAADSSTISQAAWTSFTADDVGEEGVNAVFQDRDGYLWFGTDGGGQGDRLGRIGASRYDGHTWTTFSTEDGLAENRVMVIFQDRDGNLWFGTHTFTTAEGLPSNRTISALRDREGQLWFATGRGLTRFDGRTFTTYGTEDGLGSNAAQKIYQDRSGDLWITQRAGLSRYDGVTFTAYTDEDGLGAARHRGGNPIQQDRNGDLWFGLWAGGGVSRYDGRTFVTFNVEDGLSRNSSQVNSILQDRRNSLWIGNGAGLSQYEPDPDPGQVAFTAIDALAGKGAWTSLEDRDGNLWFGTWGDGVACYDGRDFTMYTTEDGLAHNDVLAIIQDRHGHLWFGTDGGLVSRYDGQVFQTLTREDGLTGQAVRGMFADKNGDIWMMTLNGIVRYREPEPYPPGVFVDAVVADRRYDDPSNIAISSEVTLTSFEFHGMSLKTRPGAMVTGID